MSDVTMREDQVAAVHETVTDGIDFDGLRVVRAEDGYVVGTDDDASRHVGGDLQSALADYDRHVTNWYFWHAVAPQKADRWAFLRWLERAEERDVEARYTAMSDGGLSRTWGQLHLTVTLSEDGDRRYAVRHVEDEAAEPSALDSYDDPLDARTLAKYDDDERYRPLKTAPTLQTGWHFPDLDAGALVQAVDFFYPATVANWYREREENLDVSHWHETMERQTGIYALNKTWNRGEGYEHVEWVAEACCVDSQCLKRREWEYDEDHDLAVDSGDGVFPCREPCSLVIAAARKWTKLESEEPRTYEFELTQSEKAQIETIIDAVADGEAGDVREADVYDGANRYRARYLRAKLFDEDGNLGGVETGE